MKLLPILILLAGAAVAQAQFSFTTNNGAITIAAYTGAGDTAVVPSATNGLPVVSIGKEAFLICTSLTSITIPASVTNYAWPAFVNCTNLLAVYFQGNSPVDAYPAAPPVFENDVNATLYYLPGTTNWKAALDTFPTVQWNPQILGQLIYTTNEGAINITGYTGTGGGVVIPGTINGLPVGNIGSNAFYNCASLTGVTIPGTVTNLGNQAFAGCTALAGVTIPNCVPDSGVFSNCTALTNISLSKGATTLGTSEFSGCTALAIITVPTNIASIGDWAFQNCASLNAVYFQGNAPVADATVFSGDGVETNYYLPKTSGWTATFAGRPAVPILFTYTNNGGAITIRSYIGIDGTVTIPDTLNGLPVTTLWNSTFSGCDTLTNINIGFSVNSIAGQCFVGCLNLLAINVDASNSIYSSVDGVLFDKRQDTILYYPDGRTGSYTIPNGVTVIPNYAFQGSAGLTILTVPGSVTSVDTLAFNADASLTAIYFEGNAPDFEWIAFDLPNPMTLYYLPGTAGWDTNSSGQPTALWLPQAQVGGASFGVQSNQFGFNINWASGQTVVVEAATNLANPIWSAVATNTLTSGSSYFSDPQWTNYPGRFYRLRSS